MKTLTTTPLIPVEKNPQSFKEAVTTTLELGKMSSKVKKGVVFVHYCQLR